ncbi:MAG: endolytic transglycosylase MltG [Nitrospirota bacterium]
MNRVLVPGLVAAALCAMGVTAYLWIMQPAAADGAPPARVVDIAEGTTFKQVASLLARERLIRSQWGFLLLGRLTAADRRVPAGEYEIHAGMTPAEILSKLLNGQVVLHQVTIPEGYTAIQVAELLGQKGLVDPQEFLRLVYDREFIRTLNLEVDGLEGYLFPDTYRFPRHARPGEIVQAMVSATLQVLTPELRARAEEINMSLHQVLTLASVVEKETGVDAERELVASVFHNRLRRHIPLQSDPTVIYGLPSFNGNLRKRDLASASPYNTYRFAGLPPGPIANPGAASIKAVLYPAPSRFLYFVSRNDGTHEFSASLADHNRAVAKYQPRRPNRTGSRPLS